MDKEMKYRSIHSTLCMCVVILGNIVSSLAGAGMLVIIAQSSVFLAVILQWYVILKGRKQDNIEKVTREIEEFSTSLDSSHAFGNYTYLHPAARRWYYRWYDKWKEITYVHLWTYTFSTDINGKNKLYEFETEIKFPITNKQLFEMQLKGYVDMNEPKDVIPALEYIGNELCDRVLAGPKEELTA